MIRTSEFDLHRLNSFFESEPETPLFARYARELLKHGKLQQARLICEKGIKNHRFYLSGFIVLAEIYLASSEFQLAKKSIDFALKLSPDCISAKILSNKLSGILKGEKIPENISIKPQPEVKKSVNEKHDDSISFILKKFNESDSLLIKSDPNYKPSFEYKESNSEIYSDTMLNIYISQGYYDKAKLVLEKLMKRYPEKKSEYLKKSIEIEAALKG